MRLRVLLGGLPSWLRQGALLVVIYVAVMWACTHWLVAWHDWDWQFFDWLKPAPTELSSQIALIDMRYDDPADVPQHRQMLASFITAAAAQHPAAIILDIPFGQCLPTPCNAQMEAPRRRLIQAIDGAKRQTPVFANVGPMTLTPTGVPEGNAPELDPDIYHAFTGYGHTAAIVLTSRESDSSGDLFYYPCYPAYPALFRGATPTDVWDLADVALYSAELTTNVSSRETCDPSERIAVRYGPVVADRPPTEYQISASAPFPRGSNFSGKYIVVGVPAFDLNDSTTHRPGSELFAWIVGDELTYQQFRHTVIQPQGDALRFLVPLFSALVVLAFIAWFLFLKRLPLGLIRRFLPAVATLLSFCTGLALFVAFEMLLIEGPSHQIQPQVALILLGMLVAAGLCGVRGWQIERELLYRIDDPTPPEHYDFDVFLSYAHSEGDWVRSQIYLPLKQAGLNVFHDASSIRIGSSWQDSIALAMRGSRIVVPVLSEAYFSRPYCRYEIRRAHDKWVNAEDSRSVLPIMLGHVAIPEAIAEFQAISVDDDPTIVRQVIDEIVERLSRPVPPPRGAAAT